MAERRAATGGAAAPPAEALLAVQELARRYGPRLAVESLSFALAPGGIHGFVGANGGGKTTALRMLAGILRPDAGRGHVLGFDLLHRPAEIRKHVGYMAQRLSLYADLSVLENLRFRAEVYGLARPRAAAEAAAERFGLDAYARAPAGRLSGGWARRLQLAAALIHAPRLVLLDEPTAGLDAPSRQEVWRRIGGLAAEGVGVIVATHDLAEAERCTSAAFFCEGRILARGTPEEIARSAGAVAFLLAGAQGAALTLRIDEVPGVLASHPQGGSLRIVARPGSEERLRRLADAHGGRLTPVAVRLEDAALVFCARSAA